ncbi:Ribosomal RNA-processing protein 17 [Golovinomyces cichoracearum]|uniref:Ribosomal RNA-processing protein 17 n=1 Tax=Golovinomyces cichoracearum TaxID=62708 RepID=A0A420IIH5_9PEZI|nr:Ribosomal RNA-processing protein 17 [Golovinomyces cichoracearum]
MNTILEQGIFRHPRPKKVLLIHANKKRRTGHKIENISFDTSSREEYLSGFHKRKVARVKAAQAEAEKKYKEERKLTRKKLRESRKQELENHIQAVNAALKTTGNDREDEDKGEQEIWNGFCDDNSQTTRTLNYTEEFLLDEGKCATVTIEALDVSKDGLLKDACQEVSEAQKTSVIIEKCEINAKKKWPKKPPKKKFRYESKMERKLVRAKQSSEKKKQASARKSNSSR